MAEENGVYKIHLQVGEGEYDSYVTRDGKIFFIEGINLESSPDSAQGEGGEATAEAPKQDVPDVSFL